MIARGAAFGPFACLLAGCVGFDEAAPPARWSGDVEALLAPCAECHDPERPPALDYLSLLGCRDDGERWIRPGDPDSPLVAALVSHNTTDSVVTRIERWIAEGAVFSSALAHPAGFATKHAAVVRGDGLARCRECHDRPRELGGAPPCSTCHLRSFDRCDACHGDLDPRPRPDPCDDPVERAAVGAHAAHADPSRDPAYPAIDCATCHRVPDTVEASGHLADGTPRAEVTLAPALGAWDASSRTCSGVACHGGRTVAWTDTSAARCDRCHGAPPPDHRNDRCALCHIDAAHLDGEVQVGTDCADCHRIGDRGAHATHLSEGAFAIAATCDDCHQVPIDRDDPGHLDSDLPAEISFATRRALAGGRADPTWDGARCENVGCHGGHLEGSTGSIEWSGGAIACGDCHTLPPIFVRGGEGIHLPTGSAECGTCHRTREGAPITEGTDAISEPGRAVHADGCVDLGRGCAR